MSASKLPTITMNDWLKAEEQVKTAAAKPRPIGSITPQEYAEVRGCGAANAQKLLRDMVIAGLATREKWRNGMSGTRYYYQLKPQGKHTK